MSKVWKYIGVTIIFLFVLFAVFEWKFYNYESKTPVKKVMPIPELYKRVLIFAPHPDDETLGASGIIQNAIKYGGKVKVVIMTNGDSFTYAVTKNYNISNPKPVNFLHLGYDRQKESINALKYLGVDRKNIIFLGYPDKGLSILWGSHWNIPYKSFGTKVTHSPYDNSFTKNVLYEGKNVVNDLKKIIEEYNPTLLVFPQPNEVHPDHWATNSFVKYTLNILNKNNLPQYLYIVHRNDWPLPFGKHTELNLNPPANLLNTGTEWYLYPLDKKQINKKGTATMMYKTQTKVMKDFLLAFDRKTELYGFYPDGLIKKFKENYNMDDYKVIIDPARDNIRDYKSSNADITDVYAYMKNNNLQISIKCREKASPIYTYNFYGILFKNHKEIGRIITRVTNGKIVGSNGNVNIKNGLVEISIPINKDFDNIYISASSVFNRLLIDKTAWRMLKKS